VGAVSVPGMSFFFDFTDDDLDDEYWDDEPPPLPLSLDAARQRSLAAAIDTGLRERGCDATLRPARVGCGGRRRPAGARTGAAAQRGYCDCEVVLSVVGEPRGTR
jgi:hypothetical protein